MEAKDSWVVIMLLIFAAAWLYFRLKHQQGNMSIYRQVPRHDEIVLGSEEALALVQDAGYEWIAGKVKIPVTVILDNVATESRLFADGFVEKGNAWYVVKFARDRKPIDLTGSALREHLLVYSLLYPDAAGVLYVDVTAGMIRTVQFEVDL
ncbi:hypothetical protein [Paenibacillus koleovorans]|uniref:hypothetical protein n=1 Tax=Paenibacillus koleovorans TaxID=121608 RepID=UPI000FD9ED7A|nr:hypothetical protein [Paenibacillus koleovorans]